MKFLRKLAEYFTAPAVTRFTYYPITVQCRRCGQVIDSQINLNNDLSIEYSEDGSAYYICRKIILGNDTCFQQIEVNLKFSPDRQVIAQSISGGDFVDE
ncbi:MAG: hypothetical protein ABIJ39_01890 [Chloroflexota bacterium]